MSGKIKIADVKAEETVEVQGVKKEPEIVLASETKKEINVTKEDVINEKSFLSAEVRADIASQLNSMGIETGLLSDAELLKRLSNLTSSLNKQVIKAGAETLQQKLNRYARTKGIAVTDKEFIARLFKLTVLPIYLHLFDDHDKKLTDDKIWLKIRKSRIKPIEDLQEVFRMRGKK